MLTSDAVTTNSSGDEGGGLENISLGSTATLVGTTVDGNNAVTDGGGVATSEGGSLIMANDEVDQNTTPGTGGGVVVFGVLRHAQSTATIAGTSVNENSASGGGGLDLSRSTVELRNDAVISNTSTGDGAGIVSDVDTSLAVTDTTVAHNSAGGNGGGVDFPASATAGASLDNDSIDANSAAGDGGGLYNNGSSVVLDAATGVNRNIAGAGGGIYDPAATVVLNGATVGGNKPDNCEPASC
jgi:fibronectin-binding autotransporter adhesin